jgi:Diadenosine tetraphosphate (Ap4A) hydrolase and other HIT family hydrolases
LKILWAPWRLKGVTERAQKCIFCEMISEDKSQDEKNLIVYRGNKIFIVMNKYPYNNGHVMLVPYRHITKFLELSNDEIIEVLDLLKKLESCYQKTMSPSGFNLGVNLGIDAGAGYEHLHFHLVPRWRGDTSFMPVIADTKVIPESLIDSYKKLKGCFE